MRDRIRAILSLLAVLLPATALAQPAAIDRGTPEAAARGYARAEVGHDVAAIVAYTHPDVLDTFKARMSPVYAYALTSDDPEWESLRNIWKDGARSAAAIDTMSAADFARDLLAAVTGDGSSYARSIDVDVIGSMR